MWVCALLRQIRFVGEFRADDARESFEASRLSFALCEGDQFLFDFGR